MKMPYVTFLHVPPIKTNQSAHPRSLVSIHLSAWRNVASLAIQNAPSEDSDQTAQMRSLIRIFAGRTCAKVRFLTEAHTSFLLYTRSQGYKKIFMLNSAKHEIFSANKYENAFSCLVIEKFSCSALISKKEFAIVNNLRFISRTNFMLS